MGKTVEHIYARILQCWTIFIDFYKGKSHDPLFGVRVTKVGIHNF